MTRHVTYDDIERRFAGEGIRIGDVHGAHGHFAAWHRLRGLPDRDADGMEIGSSRIFMSMYEADPEGRAQRPQYVNFWHWLLNVYEDVPWEETPQGRRKTVRLSRGMHKPRAPLTQVELDAAIAEIARASDFPPEMRSMLDESLRGDLAEAVVRRNEGMKVADAVLDQFGEDITIEMTV